MESRTSEFIPRAYQIDLYEKAIENNIVLYLPTGAGKTYIAVLLLKKLSVDIRKSYHEGGKRSVFAVNTVALVSQQAEYISRHTGLACKGYSGDMRVDLWNEVEWLAEIEAHQVLVMTSQILYDILARKYLSLNKINLIVFDECHRAVNNHPMRQIMQHFEMYPKEQQPRVLAMSASLLNANIKLKKIEDTIKCLEITFHAKIATVKSTDCIEGYCTNPKEDIISFREYIIPNVAIKINQIILNAIDILKNIKINSDELYNESSRNFQPKKKSSKLIAIIKDIETNIAHTGIYGSNKAALLHLIQLECIKKFCDDQQMVLILEYLITQVIIIRKLLEDEMKNYTELERIRRFTTDQLHKVFKIVKDFNDNKQNDQRFCCIIFVKERFMTQVIYHILKNLRENDEQYNFLQPDFIIGFHNSRFKNSREVLCIAKWNKEVLHRFKNGITNCVVATDVVDEGIDVPTCTLIIRYDMPMDFRGYVQSKGRARHGLSHYKILMPENDNTFYQRYKQYQETESELKMILIGRSELRELPTDSDIKDNLYKHDIKPYTIMHNNEIKSVLMENAAISLVNMYCCSLLKSKFVHLIPTWTLHQNKEILTLYQVSLKLPNISQLKHEIFGDPMPNIDAAKRSVAMKCCIQLHKIGELTDKLMPPDVHATLQRLEYLFPNWSNEDPSDRSCGTYKKKRLHKLQHPAALYGAFPCSTKKLYLHVLHATPTYSRPYDNRHLTFYNLLNDKSSFGILSTKSMPKIPSFPIFMNVGELCVNVKSNYATMSLNEQHIKLLTIYHSLLFSEVVPVIKKFLIFDKDNLENSFFIVPLNACWEINWDIITDNRHIERITPSPPFHVKNSNYELTLVTPSYRGSVSVYVVTQVCDDLTPRSCFPTDDFDSYTHYYKERHGLVIQNPDQPMLEVKPISTKINCIRPRSMKPGLSKRKRADILEDFEEHLIPELCQIINFPALYWLKASTLPSILHRISQLLLAEDLRITIVKETGLGTLTLLQDEEWRPLDIMQKEVDQLMEPLLDITLDDSIETTQLEPDLNEPELDVFNAQANSYPWPKDQEPQDLYRNMEQVQVIDIEYYNSFMSVKCDDTDMKNVSKTISYMMKPTVPVPPLILLLKKKRKLCGPSPVEIMHALTTKMAHDVFDLERLETLGDSYLKFITSLFLYHSFPMFNEGQLTALKGKMIGNRNLYYSGKNKCIPGYMKIEEFVPVSTFIVPAYTVFRPLQEMLLDATISPSVLYELIIPEEERFSGYISEDTLDIMKKTVLNWISSELHTGMEHFLGVQIMPDKAIADSVEALIGVYLKSNGINGAAELLKWFGILPDIQIQELLSNDPPNPVIGDGDPNYHMPWADSMETNFGYKFKNRAFLLQAFTHPSYTANGITECYQRLEFLGDAILDFLITCHIYETCGKLSPGDLTDLRSALVNNITFACLAVRYGLHTGLLAYAPKLNDLIDRFVKFQEDRSYATNDELLWVLLEEEECNMAEYVDVPKVLGDLFESLIGAIYLDSGKNLMKVWEITYALMHTEIEEFSKNVPKQPVRLIYENTELRPKFMDAVFIESTNSVMVPLKVTIAGKEKLFHGFGTNKKQAKCAAAKQVLKRLRCK